MKPSISNYPGHGDHRTTGPARLATLASFLQTVPEDRLTLSYWFNEGRGCAVGLAAATQPWFRAQGLRLEDRDLPVTCRPVYRGLSDWEAVAAFFDISLEQAGWLFLSRSYTASEQPLPERIAGRIWEFLLAPASNQVNSQRIVTA